MKCNVTLNLKSLSGGSANGIPLYEKYLAFSKDFSTIPLTCPTFVDTMGASLPTAPSAKAAAMTKQVLIVDIFGSQSQQASEFVLKSKQVFAALNVLFLSLSLSLSVCVCVCVCLCMCVSVCMSVCVFGCVFVSFKTGYR